MSDEQETRLGQVVGDLDRPRGADGAFSITVPAAWLEQGSKLLVRIPKKLVCAACEGGGCDICGRSGALVLSDVPEDERVLDVTLPGFEVAQEMTLRIPRRAMPSPRPDEPPGHLFLRIVPGASASPCVALERSDSAAGRAHLDRSLVTRSTLMAVGLVGLFLLMLRLSGWM